ncbi:HAD family hydrolase [Flexithrix dorotheae]|uniref:HAD family hydrolase n=1 Tax=Flexithrix dorotheae TaxID=70993 RepID=UPI0003758A28|nr:HAD family phosphatase [Flexithrix dorotheae]
MKNIDNIIFDLGGVIMNLDFHKTISSFNELMEIDFFEVFNGKQQQPVIDAIETGQVTPEEFRAELRKLFNITADDATIDAAWNAMLLDFPKEKIELVKTLKERKRTFLLSNTNAIHLIEAGKRLSENYNGLTLEDMFEKTYYSHIVKDRKPNTSIYQLIIDENQLDPERTVFIDDNFDNIEGAKKTGLKTIHITGNVDILNLEF